MRKITILTVLVLFLFIGKKGVPSYAEEGVGMGPGVKDSYQANVQALKKLKEKDPEAYRQKVAEKQERVRARLEELKQTHPEKYREYMEHHRKVRREYLAHLRETNPEKFKEIMQQRRQHLEQRLQNLKKNHPETYERIIRRREERRKVWVGRRRNHRENGHERLHHDQGVRDQGQGEGRDKVGQGGEHRSFRSQGGTGGGGHRGGRVGDETMSNKRR